MWTWDGRLWVERLSHYAALDDSRRSLECQHHLIPCPYPSLNFADCRWNSYAFFPGFSIATLMLIFHDESFENSHQVFSYGKRSTVSTGFRTACRSEHIVSVICTPRTKHFAWIHENGESVRDTPKHHGCRLMYDYCPRNRVRFCWF